MTCSDVTGDSPGPRLNTCTTVGLWAAPGRPSASSPATGTNDCTCSSHTAGLRCICSLHTNEMQLCVCLRQSIHLWSAYPGRNPGSAPRKGKEGNGTERLSEEEGDGSETGIRPLVYLDCS